MLTEQDIYEKSLYNSNIPISKIIAIGMDGPNVNEKVSRLLNGRYKFFIIYSKIH